MRCFAQFGTIFTIKKKLKNTHGEMLVLVKFKPKAREGWFTSDIPVKTGRKLNVLCMFNLRPVSTGVSFNIKVFFKENHLDWLSIHFFNKERTWGKPLIIRSTQNRLNQAYIRRNLEIHRLRHGQSLEKGLERWAGLNRITVTNAWWNIKKSIASNNRPLCSKRSL